MGRVVVPREPIADAILDALRDRGDRHQPALPAQGWRENGSAGATSLEIIIGELARYTGLKRGSARRLLWRILKGQDTNHGKPWVIDVVTFEQADRILCALDMNERWHTDERLRAVYESL